MQLKIINETLNDLTNTPSIDIANVLLTLLLAYISIHIANKSLKLATSSEDKRATEIKKENQEYLEKVDVILNKTLTEINDIVDRQNKALTNKTSTRKLQYIKETTPYIVQEVKSRLHIICSFEFSKMDSIRLNDLYEVRTLVAGVYNGLYGYEKNLVDKCFSLVKYERYLTDTLEGIKSVESKLYIDTKNKVSDN